MQTHDVLILTGEFLEEDERHELRFYGRSPDIGPVVLVFDQSPPLFFVDRQEKLPALEAPFDRKQLHLKSFSGRPVDGLYFRTHRDLRQAAERFRATGVRHFEADVYPVERFLMERFIHGRAKIAGTPSTQSRITEFRNPKIKAGEASTDLILASLDIETGMESGQLYSIAIHLTGLGREGKRVFMLAESAETVDDVLTYHPSERDLLVAFFRWFQQADPDLIIGWHVVGFDLMFLERKCRELGLHLDLARSEREIVLTEKPGSGYFATISGRAVVDGPRALRGCGFSFANYKLETVSQELLDSGKLITPGQDKVAEIDRLFREDKPQLARYNLEDCVLVTRVFAKTRLIPLLLQRVYHSGLLLDQIAIANVALDHHFLPRLHRQGLVAHNVEDGQHPDGASGPAITNAPGVYEHVVSLDLGNSLASLIHAFQIDPVLEYRRDTREVEGEPIFPKILKALLERRAAARKSAQDLDCRAIDLTLKALCGNFEHKNFRFRHPALLTALDKAARGLFEMAEKLVAGAGHQLIRADTEVFLVEINQTTPDPQALGKKLVAQLQTDLEKELPESAARLELRFHRYYPKLVLTSAKGKETPGKPCFAALAGGEKPALVIEGMEHALTAWTPFGRKFLTQLFHRYFAGEGFEAWLRDHVQRLKTGAFDDQLAYRKKILKDLDAYSKNPPAHIRAARMLTNPGREIHYVWTKRGPVPTDLKPTDLDYEHYIQKQIQPLADLLLNLSGQSFTDLTEPKQLGLF